MACYHEVQRKTSCCSPSINCQRPNFVSLIHSFLLPLYLPPLPLCLYLSQVCRQQDCRLRENDGIDIPLAGNLHSLFIYQYNTPSHSYSASHSTLEYWVCGCVYICFELSVCEVKNVHRGLGLDCDVSNQQRKVISANEMNMHRHTEGVYENK